MRKMGAWIDFSAEGGELSAFRGGLRSRHFPCRQQQMCGGSFHAQTRARNWYGIVRLAEETGTELTVHRKTGLRFRLRPYRLRFGLLAGMLLACAFFWWSNAYVRRIEINGNTEISDGEILSALDALGVREGTPFRAIPFTYVEQCMRLSVSRIEWIALRHTGGRLVVDLTEEHRGPETVPDRMPCNVVAAVPAQITGINVLGGTAVRQIGDAVRAGDLLISGISADPFGVTRCTHADGIVTGIYETEFSREQPYCAEVTVPGEPVSERFLSVFGKRFSLSFRFRPPEGDFIYEETQEPLTLFGRTLPIAQITGSYTPLLPTIAVYSEDEVRAMLEESASIYERNFHQNDRILSRKAVFVPTDLGISLKIHYEIEGVIGKTSEIFVKLS